MEFWKKKHLEKKWNLLLDAVVTILKYNKITIDHDTEIKVFSDGTVPYLTVSTDDVLKTTNNEIESPELRRVFKEDFGIKVHRLSVLKYPNFRICQYPIGLSIDKTDKITELVNE